MYVDQEVTVPTHGIVTSAHEPPVKENNRTHTSVAERKPSEGEYFKIWQRTIFCGYTVDMPA